MNTRKQEKPAVAIIGAGVAGLSAAYYLCKTINVTIFEKETYVGGRVLTSNSPPGEHGAEFLLKTEKSLIRLLHELGLEEEPAGEEWPCYFVRRYGLSNCKSPDEAALDLLPEQSAERVNRLLMLAQTRYEGPDRNMKMSKWMDRFLQGDTIAISFIEMLLRGETCAPLNHITTRYGLECLQSVICDEWYRVRGGTTRFSEALAEHCRHAGAVLKTAVEVTRIKETREGVVVRYKAGGRYKTEIFHGAIVATPNGETLVGFKPRGHFHSYLNVLLEFATKPRISIAPRPDLADGLYTDGPLNYVQLVTTASARHTLRILIPNPKMSLTEKPDPYIANFCLEHLKQVLKTVPAVCARSILRWRYGLPCGGDSRGKGWCGAGGNIFLAGDRFGKWPSMDAAIESGRNAGESLLLRWGKNMPSKMRVGHARY